MTDKNREGPQLVRELIPDVLALSRKRYEERLTLMLERGVDLDALVTETPVIENEARRYLLPLLPADLRAREFLDCTTDDHVVEATARLALCDKCPERGGMCRGEQRQGHTPSWEKDPEDPGITWMICNRWRVHILDRRMIDLGFPSKLVAKTFRNYVTETEELKEALTTVVGWAKDFRYFQTVGKGLLLMGSTGIGKTHLAVAASRWLMAHRFVQEPVFWEYATLMRILRQHDEETKSVVRQAMNSDLLVIDDLNTLRTTDWVRESLGSIINHRWSNNLLCIVTSNNNLQDYADALGPRIISRIEDMCGSIDWVGRNWRSTDNDD